MEALGESSLRGELARLRGSWPQLTANWDLRGPRYVLLPAKRPLRSSGLVASPAVGRPSPTGLDGHRLVNLQCPAPGNEGVRSQNLGRLLDASGLDH